MSYDRVSYKSVVDEMLGMCGQSQSQLDATQKLQINGYVNSRLRDWAWIGAPWEGIVLTEKRRFRADYASGTPYVVTNEVYFPATRQYYQALRSTTGNAPATYTGGQWVVNAAYWAVAAGPYNASDWVGSHGYVVGDQVRNPDDGEFYQCHTAHTSSTSFDATKFGQLTIFDAYIAKAQSWEDNEIGTFIGMYLDDPTKERNPRRVSTRIDGTGIHVLTSPYSRWGRGLGVDFIVPTEVYVTYRLPCPEFRGSAYSGSATYTANVDVIYFEGVTTDLEGDYWACLTNTSAGESPATAPAKWQRLNFPAILRTPVARRALADWLRYGGQRLEAMREDGEAQASLFQAQILNNGQQGQTIKWRKNG